MNKSSRNVALIVMLGVTTAVGGVYALMPSASTQSLTADGGNILGHIQLVLTDTDGNIKAYRQTDNLIVTNGLESAAEKLFGADHTTTTPTIGTFNVVQVGIDSTAPAAANENLGTPRSNKRLDSSVATSGQNGAVIDANWAAGRLHNGSGTTAITESGVFDSVTNATGNMFARQTFTAINVGAADSLTVTWTITFADSDST